MWSGSMTARLFRVALVARYVSGIGQALAERFAAGSMQALPRDLEHDAPQ